MLENDADNGYKVYVHATAVGMLLSPVTAPHGSTTHIQVKPSKRYLAKDCSPHGHLIKTDVTSMYHDPDGIVDTGEAIGKMIMSNVAVCRLPIYAMKADNESVCSPHLIYVVSYVVTLQSDEVRRSLQNIFVSIIGYREPCTYDSFLLF